MPISPCHLFKSYYRHLPAEDINVVPDKVRGIYVLFNQTVDKKHMNVVYVGMARGEASGAKGRLKRHKDSKEKMGQWSHFSLFEVWDNISRQQVEELEGLFGHIYATDEHANAFNVQKNYTPFEAIMVPKKHAPRKSSAKV